MEVTKFITKDGRIFYSAFQGPDFIAATLKRLPEWRSIELIEMPEKEYYAIPATSEAAELWRSVPTYEQAQGEGEGE